jgi:hypothetical protein
VPKKLSKLQQKLMNDLSKEDTAESLWYSILIDSYFYNWLDPPLFLQPYRSIHKIHFTQIFQLYDFPLSFKE